ncbi:glutathione S-transferase [Elysia marginata]|uniref:Glutathione S-transferase n=1 Tax=Elysia marginata TaxID=1093978 RepID=A0AAV4GM74_9GAST|nr:glutathione S-transferase [Elysia marginata]
MSVPKLTYFAIRGRGELARLVMAAARKHMDEVTVDFAEWPEMQPATTFGVLPTLEINGKEYFQGNAIATYLARENGLYGNSNLESLMIDQVVQLKEDILTVEISTVYGSDAEKMSAAKKLISDIYPRTMKIFNNFIQENPANSGFVVGDKAYETHREEDPGWTSKNRLNDDLACGRR